MARMTAKGYVRRTRSTEDGRAYALEITDEGVALLARILPQDADVEAAVLAPIPPELRPATGGGGESPEGGSVGAASAALPPANTISIKTSRPPATRGATHSA
ncbi:hypothetical protein G6F68_017300 [Rhizopus microsporus]|nr:hypothetical protein G6F68_017300 [Rhizopus microsporus]